MTPQLRVQHSLNHPSRRTFLQGIGAMSLAMGGNAAWAGGLRKALSESATRRGKHVTLLADGGFEQGAWGWQFTAGAAVTSSMRHRGRPVVQVTSQSGDYARFFLIDPESW